MDSEDLTSQKMKDVIKAKAREALAKLLSGELKTVNGDSGAFGEGNNYYFSVTAESAEKQLYFKFCDGRDPWGHPFRKLELIAVLDPQAVSETNEDNILHLNINLSKEEYDKAYTLALNASETARAAKKEKMLKHRYEIAMNLL